MIEHAYWRAAVMQLFHSPMFHKGLHVECGPLCFVASGKRFEAAHLGSPYADGVLANMYPQIDYLNVRIVCTGRHQNNNSKSQFATK